MNENTKTSIRGLNPALLHQAKIEAVTQRVTIGAWINKALEEKLKNDSKKIRA
jgi:predicted HicB family RNase H-like nuclease